MTLSLPALLLKLLNLFFYSLKPAIIATVAVAVLLMLGVFLETANGE
jgi:hypothetical protein